MMKGEETGRDEVVPDVEKGYADTDAGDDVEQQRQEATTMKSTTTQSGGDLSTDEEEEMVEMVHQKERGESAPEIRTSILVKHHFCISSLD